MKSIVGKITGGLLGFAVGGPPGAVIGLAIGHVHDLQRDTNGRGNAWENMATAAGDFAANTQQAAFTMGVIVLGAKMAKADGRVTRAEIEAFKRVFQVQPSQVDHVGRLFDHARLSAKGFEPYAFQLAHMFRNNRTVLEEILGGLFIIAASDSAGLSPAEIVFLKRVGSIFSFTPDDFVRVAARAGIQLPNQEKQNPAQNSSYAILGISERASAEEIKIAYRALIREHHPDRLVAQGMPPEFIANATEKMKRINVAYDAICKQKGIH